MSHPPITVPTDANLEMAARAMLDRAVGCLPVVDTDGRLVGIVTESDFTAKRGRVPFSTFEAPKLFGEWLGSAAVEKLYHVARTHAVTTIMSQPVHTVGEDDGLEQVLELMLKHRIKHIVVLREGRPVGVLARHDMLRLLRDRL